MGEDWDAQRAEKAYGTPDYAAPCTRRQAKAIIAEGYRLMVPANGGCPIRPVTIADSPMRVKTGPLVGNWLEKPKDKDGRTLDMSVLEALDKARFSVPQWYPDYPGMYFGDGNVLDVPGGDFQAIENLRVIQKCMRKVYPLAVARIAACFFTPRRRIRRR